MRVFQQSVTRRNVTQRKSFFGNKKALRTFTQPQTPQRRLRLFVALRKQVETTSIFFLNAGGELDQSELRLRSTNGCGTEAAVRCVALRNDGKRALLSVPSARDIVSRLHLIPVLCRP